MRRSKFEQRITTPEQLLALVRYERDEGALYWLPRVAKDFGWSEKTTKGWNTKYAGKRCGAIHSCGYRFINGGNNELFFEHRAIWFIETGVWPDEVDHIDGNRLDNRMCNMRDVDRVTNGRNMVRFATNTSGITGVYWDKRQVWTASIKANNRNIHLYIGPDKQAAIKARKDAEEKYGFHPNHGRPSNATGR